MFKQKSDTASAATAPADPVQRARTRARQRLIGAIVLLAIGIIGFPLVFETQPRPIPVDIPIEIPKKDALPPLVAPPPTPASSAAPVAVALPASRPRPATPAEPKPAEEIITESRSEAGREFAPRAASAPAPAKPADAASRSSADGERARALLEGRPASAADAQRFVVQVGAFADADAAREIRLKVEKLGLRTYTQIAQTPSGNRIRVRVGPFASRGEADAALAKAKTAGLDAVVLTL
jgi:DedD protein